MIRGKILFISLIVMGTTAAFLGIAQMWWEPFTTEIFLKTLATVLLLGTLASFLMAVDYDLPGSKGKFLLGVLVLMAALSCGLIIGQMWWSFMAAITFGKIMVTLIIITGLLAFFMAVREDFGGNKKLKDDKFID